MLKTFPDAQIVASHPTSIDPLLLHAALQGLRVKEDKGLLASLVSGESQMEAVFTEEELHFLTPHLEMALSQSTPEEFVSFLIKRETSSHPVMTRGSLYRTRHFLRLGLQSFQVNKQQTRLSSKASFSTNRITHWSLGFFPEGARIQEEGTMATYPILSDIGSVTLDLNALHNITQTQQASFEKGDSPEPTFQELKDDEQHIQGLEKEIGELQKALEKQNQKLKQLEHRLE